MKREFPISQSDMLNRERERLLGLTTEQLFVELYGDTRSDLVDDLMESYAEGLECGEIVPCCECGQDCMPDVDAVEDEEDEWICEQCE